MSQTVVNTLTEDRGSCVVTRVEFSDGSMSEQVEWKTGTAQANFETVRQRALDALSANRDFVASTPTAAQVTAQVKALTRQQNGLIRLLLGQLDDTT